MNIPTKLIQAVLDWFKLAKPILKNKWFISSSAFKAFLESNKLYQTTSASSFGRIIQTLSKKQAKLYAIIHKFYKTQSL